MPRSKKGTKQTVAAASSADLRTFFGPTAQRRVTATVPEIIVISDDEEELPKPNVKLKHTLEGDPHPVNKRSKLCATSTDRATASGSTLPRGSRVVVTPRNDCGTGVDPNLAADDEWEMGDDEFDIQELKAEPEILEGTFPATTGQINTCPVCGKGFLKSLFSVSHTHSLS